MLEENNMTMKLKWRRWYKIIGPSIEVPDVNETHETEDTLRRKQLEKMAKENPEEFAKLLRTWIAEE